MIGFLQIIGTATLVLVGQSLLGLPSPLGSPFLPMKQVGVACLIGSYVVAMTRIGSLLLDALHIEEKPYGLRVGVGSAAFSFFSLLIALSNFLPSLSVTAFLLLVLTPMFFPSQRSLKLPCSQFSWLVFVLCVIRGITALYPDLHPDALWYNLSAPYSWLGHGGLPITLSNPAFIQASTWEYLYLLPMGVLTDQTGNGMVAAHIACQLLHLLVGVVGSVSLLNSLISSYRPELPKVWKTCVLVVVLSVPSMYYTQVTAKNDWGSALWFLSGLYLLFRYPQKSYLLGGIVLGWSVSAKLPYLLPVLALFLLFIRTVSKSNAAWTMAGFLASVGIFATRNFTWTGNPFYPSLASFFPHSPIPEAWRSAMSLFHGTGAFSLEVLSEKFFQFFPLSHPFLGVGALLGASVYKSSDRFVQRTLLFLGFSIALFLIGTGAKAEARLMGAVPLLCVVVALVAFYDSVKRWLPSTSTRIIPVFLIVHSVLASEIWYSNLPNILKGWTANNFIREAPSGRSLLWLASQPDSPSVTLLNETRVYYFLPFSGTRLFDDSRANIGTFASSKEEQAERIVHSLDTSYLLLTRITIDGFFDPDLSRAIIDYVRKSQLEVVVSTEDEKLVLVNQR